MDKKVHVDAKTLKSATREANRAISNLRPAYRQIQTYRDAMHQIQYIIDNYEDILSD